MESAKPVPYLKKKFLFPSGQSFKEIIILFLAIIFSILWMFFSVTDHGALAIISIIATGCMVVYYNILSDIDRGKLMRIFAFNYGFKYAESIDKESLNKTLVLGRVDYMVEGIDSNLSFRSYFYTYNSGGGDTATTTVFEYSFDHRFPAIEILSASDRPAKKGMQNLTFEGNFSTLFRVQVQDGYEQEAYQRLTPDVMEFFMEQNRFVLELSDTAVLISVKEIKKIETMEETFSAVQNIMVKIAPTLRSIHTYEEIRPLI